MTPTTPQYLDESKLTLFEQTFNKHRKLVMEHFESQPKDSLNEKLIREVFDFGIAPLTQTLLTKGGQSLISVIPSATPASWVEKAGQYFANKLNSYLANIPPSVKNGFVAMVESGKKIFAGIVDFVKKNQKAIAIALLIVLIVTVVTLAIYWGYLHYKQLTEARLLKEALTPDEEERLEKMDALLLNMAKELGDAMSIASKLTDKPIDVSNPSSALGETVVATILEGPLKHFNEAIKSLNVEDKNLLLKFVSTTFDRSQKMLSGKNP